MKLVTAVSDIHGSWDDLPNPPDANILAFAGDLTTGLIRNAIAFFTWAEQFVPYFDDVIVVPGNHDGCFDTAAQLMQTEAGNRGLNLLVDAALDAHGTRVYGTPWSTRFGHWYFMDDERGLEQRYQQIPADTQLLISHGPAYGYLDVVRRDGSHAGSRALRDCIENRLDGLQALVHGHIHESRGRRDIRQRLTAYNVACLDDRYCMVADPWVNFTL